MLQYYHFHIAIDAQQDQIKEPPRASEDHQGEQGTVRKRLAEYFSDLR